MLNSILKTPLFIAAYLLISGLSLQAQTGLFVSPFKPLIQPPDRYNFPGILTVYSDSSYTAQQAGPAQVQITISGSQKFSEAGFPWPTDPTNPAEWTNVHVFKAPYDVILNGNGVATINVDHYFFNPNNSAGPDGDEVWANDTKSFTFPIANITPGGVTVEIRLSDHGFTSNPDVSYRRGHYIASQLTYTLTLPNDLNSRFEDLQNQITEIQNDNYLLQQQITQNTTDITNLQNQITKNITDIAYLQEQVDALNKINPIVGIVENPDLTYTLTYKDGSTFTTTPQNNITSFVQNVDGTYTVTYRDGTTLTTAPTSGIESSVVDANGDLLLTLSDGRTLNAGQARGKDGSNGKDGKDGKKGKSGSDGDNGAWWPGVAAGIGTGGLLWWGFGTYGHTASPAPTETYTPMTSEKESKNVQPVQPQ